jgi:hypothetical protein
METHSGDGQLNAHPEPGALDCQSGSERPFVGSGREGAVVGGDMRPYR